MSKFVIGQRVNTEKYGDGVIVSFEACVTGFSKCLYPETYEDGMRIGVLLDKPENWPPHAVSSGVSGVPYFVPRDFK